MQIKIQDKLFEFVYAQALRDAIVRRAYTGESAATLLGKKSPHALINSSRLAALAMHEVNSYVNALYNRDGFATQEAHDKLHEIVSARIVDIYAAYAPDQAEDDPLALQRTFTFGNAQKLVNMVAKYYYVTTRDQTSRDVFRHCHCPMDTQAINAVAGLIGALVDKSQRLDNNEAEELLEGHAHRRPRARDWQKLDDFSWGNMTSATRQPYDNFQRAVRFLARDPQVTQGELLAPYPLAPLEFDLYVWNAAK